MPSRMVILAEAVPFALELTDNVLEYLDEVTKTAGKPFYLRASNIFSMVVGAGATILALFGDRLGVPEEAQILSGMVGGKLLGRVAKQAIEYYSAKAAVAQAVARVAKIVEASAVQAAKAESKQAEAQVVVI